MGSGAAMAEDSRSPQTGDLGVSTAAEGDGKGAKLEFDAETSQLLQSLRKVVEELDPLSQGTDDATLRRFLLARWKDVEKASKMFVAHQKWRRSFVPLGYIPEEEVQKELSAEKCFLQGRDKKGRSIALLEAGRHLPDDHEVFKRYAVYCFDKTIASLPPGVEKFCCILNLKGLRLKNVDIRGWRLSFDFLQAYYPERLGKLLVLHAPYIFWGAWKVVAPFIDNATREKIFFVSDRDLPGALRVDIDEGQLPDIVGGKMALVPIQNVHTPNWPPSS